MGVPAYTAGSREVANAMSLTGQAFALTVPDDALAREDARAQASTGRFAVLGGAAAVLVLGLAVVAAAGLRREHGVLARLLAPARRRPAHGRPAHHPDGARGGGGRRGRGPCRGGARRRRAGAWRHRRPAAAHRRDRAPSSRRCPPWWSLAWPRSSSL